MSADIKKRTGNRWPKSVSGNPGGRPKGHTEVKELARAHGPAAIKRLRELMDSRDEPVAVSAAKALLERGFGKAEQSITNHGSPLVAITVASGAPITDAADAARIYQAICGNPSESMEGLRFALPAPSTADPVVRTEDDQDDDEPAK